MLNSKPDTFGRSADVLAEQVRQAHVLATFGIVATVINSTIVFLILRGFLPAAPFTAWYASVLLVTIVRTALVVDFRLKIPAPADTQFWKRTFLAGLGAMGLLWGSLGFFSFSAMPFALEVFIAFVLGGMAAGASATFCVLKGGYLVFSVPALTPLTLQFFLAGDLYHYAMAAMLTLYGILLWRVSRHHYFANRMSLLLRFENKDMIASLRSAKEDMEDLYRSLRVEMEAKTKAETDLRAEREHLERTVQERTLDLSRVNEQLEARIEELRRLDAERARAEEEVRRSEALYRAIARNMPDAAVTLVDRHFRVLLAEGGLLGRIGLARDQIEGHTFSEAFSHHQSRRLEEGFRRALSGEATSYEQEYDGRVVWAKFVPLRDETGGVRTAMNLAVDITELKHAEQEREQLIAELQRSNSELQQFAYVASHDLQEPLRTISSYVELLTLKYKGRLDPKADQYIFFAVDAARRMQELINDLLAYSRVATRGQPFRSLDMNALLKHVIVNLRTAVQESDAVITVDPLPIVRADESQMVQLFQNLISNAIKFRRTGAKPEIRVSAERKENKWVFGVHDNGIGIDPRYYERIFVIFQRLHPREEYAGTGVGLAICKRIVERHGGSLWVDSKPGEWATFYFSLPV